LPRSTPATRSLDAELIMIRTTLATLWCALGLPALAAANDRPLMCFGNEPSWSVDMTEPGAARFATPDGESVLYHGSATRLDVLGEALWRGPSADGRDLVVWVRDAECNDNMSDTRHPVTVRVSLPDGRFLAGCCRLAGAGAAASSLEGSAWRLTQIAGTEPAGLATLTRAVTVQFEAGQVRGFSGCNTFSGGYEVEGDRLKLGQLASTMMACPEPGSSVEHAFQQAFAGTLEFGVDGGWLRVGDSLRFERETPPQLDGSAWKVTSYNNNRQAVVGVIGDSDVTMSFGNGEVTGSAGCNRFHATYATEGNRIRLGPAATTRRACDEPLMTQEREFLAALASAVIWRIDGNVLDLHRADSERAIWAVSQ
jgi:heat shock protein HslJ